MDLRMLLSFYLLSAAVIYHLLVVSVCRQQFTLQDIQGASGIDARFLIKI